MPICRVGCKNLKYGGGGGGGGGGAKSYTLQVKRGGSGGVYIEFPSKGEGGVRTHPLHLPPWPDPPG